MSIFGFIVGVVCFIIGLAALVGIQEKPSLSLKLMGIGLLIILLATQFAGNTMTNLVAMAGSGR